MLRGIVPEPGKPDRYPQEAYCAEPHEDLAPGHELEQPQHERRGQAADEVSAGKEDALRSAPLAPGYPAGKSPRDARPRASLTDAKEEPDEKQRDVARGGA